MQEVQRKVNKDFKFGAVPQCYCMTFLLNHTIVLLFSIHTQDPLILTKPFSQSSLTRVPVFFFIWVPSVGSIWNENITLDVLVWKENKYKHIHTHTHTKSTASQHPFIILRKQIVTVLINKHLYIWFYKAAEKERVNRKYNMYGLSDSCTFAY